MSDVRHVAVGIAVGAQPRPRLIPHFLPLVIGIGTAFNGPASKTLPVEVVPEDAFENSATWSSSS